MAPGERGGGEVLENRRRVGQRTMLNERGDRWRWWSGHQCGREAEGESRGDLSVLV
jgi:hypothetical protein